ncbi:MAG: putative glycoside hydrolase [Elusimicrobiota bacterium]|jgi:hypothetical protein|nr:putative glycoside hydrolase [Elusimicrobiota bacterium]
MKTKTTKCAYIIISLFLLIFALVCKTSSQETSSSTSEILITDVTILETPPTEETITEEVANTVLTDIEVQNGGRFIRGIHLTYIMASVPKQQRAIIGMIKNTELNTVVIDIKEFDGKVCIPNVPLAVENKTSVLRSDNLVNFLKLLKEENIYSVARIVVFRDNLLPRLNPSMAVKNPDGTIWHDRANITWIDPYNEQAKEYIMQIAEKAADLGFDEIQFDYIRFPSDGDLSKTRYSNKQHTRTAASNVIVEFLKEANGRLKKKGVKISIDVFGLTTTASDDMGIGQKIVEMAQWVDYVSPMVYPSHYAAGAYGSADPNKEPYKIVYTAMRGAISRIPPEKLRPWLQDFTMRNYPYRKEQVRAQIQACYDNGIGSWLLWNSRCVYSASALKGPEFENIYEKRIRP